MDLKENMEFDITKKFVPNFCKAKTLKILNVNQSTVCIEMEEARSRGVFPLQQFHSLINTGALIYNENVLNDNHEDTA